MNSIIDFKKCSRFGHRKDEWTKKSLQRFIGASKKAVRKYTKSEMCELASWRAQRMTDNLIRVRDTSASILRLHQHQANYRKTYLVASPPESYDRDAAYWGRYDVDFRWTLLDYCGDGAQSAQMSFYLKGMRDKFSKPPDRTTIQIANKANTLNTLIQQAPPSPVDLVLYRAVDANDSRVAGMDESAKHVNFLKLGLLSTSYEKQDAIDFLDDGEACCLCVLLCPAGTRCLLVDSISAWAEFEHEVILPSGNLFRLQHSYYEKITNSLNGSVFDVRVLVCVLNRQFFPDDKELQAIVPNDLLSRLPYAGQYAPPPPHKPYVYVPTVIDLEEDVESDNEEQ